MYTEYPGLTTQKCEAAWEITSQLIYAASKNGVISGYVGHVVVLDSKMPYQHGQTIADLPILFQAQVGNDTIDFSSSNKARGVANAKAFQSWRTGKSSRWLQQEGSNLYDIEDTKYTGSYVGPTGIIVAFSGVQGDFDEAISETMECWLRAMCRFTMNKKPDGVLLSKFHRIGGHE